MRTALLYNPLSGFNRRHPGLAAQEASGHELATVHAVRSPAEVQAALAELAKAPPDLLIVCGGDGTVQAVLTVLFTRKPFALVPPLAVLAAGTTNMIAADAGLPGNPVQNVRSLLAQKSLAELHCVQRPILRLQIPGQEDRYGMFLGLAAISQGITCYQEHFHNQGWQGLPGIALTMARFLAAAVLGKGAGKGLSSRLVLSSENRTSGNISGEAQPEQAREAILGLITSHQRLLFGLKPFWGRESGPLRCTLVEAQVSGLAWRLPFLACGQAWAAAQGYVSWNCHELRLRIDGPLALDGELYRAARADEPVQVSCGGSLSFVRGLK